MSESSRHWVKEAIKLLQESSGHLDNTNAPCRVDYDGHDCCYICNVTEGVIKIMRDHFE